MIAILQMSAVALGLFFLLTGTIGLIRLPDVYTRMHATTKCDTLGVGLVVVGLLLRPGGWANVGKLILVLVFMWLTSPTVAHLVAQAAWLDNTAMYGIADHKEAANND